MSLFRFVIFDGKRDNAPKPREGEWADVAAWLQGHVERDEKDGKLWSPVSYPDGATRLNANVSELYALVMDIDDGTHPDALTAQWEPWEYLVYSSFSSTPEHPKWRAVFPLSRPVAGADWPKTYAKLVDALAEGITDPQCKDASRMYYTPACPPGAERFAFHHPGHLLNPDSFADLPETTPAATAPRRFAITRSTPYGRERRVSVALLLDRAVDRSPQGRNHGGLWLATQLRDAGYPEGEAEGVLLEYVRRVPGTSAGGRQEAYTEREALASLQQAYARPAREPWADRELQFQTGLNGAPHANGNGKAPAAVTVDRAVETAVDQSTKASTNASTAGDLTLNQARAICATLAERVKGNPEIVYGGDYLRAMALLRKYSPADWGVLSITLKKARISMRDLYPAFPPVALAESDRAALPEPEDGDEEPSQLAGDLLDDCPAPLLRVPQPYSLSWRSVTRAGSGEDGEPKIQAISYAPLILTGRTRDALTGDESLLTAWKWPGAGWVSRVVDRGNAFQGRKLVELAKCGFPVTEENAKQLVAYLSRLEALNRPTLPCARVSSHLGWQGGANEPFLCGRTLVLPDGTAEEAKALDVEHPENWSEKRVCFHGVGEGEEQIVDAFRSRGTFEAWRESIAPIERFPKVLIGFYASFCAPLLEVFDVPNFIVDFSNRTGTGKTTTMRVAGSVWGSPDERTPHSVIGTWDATRVFTERASAVLSGLPLIMDDTKKAKSPKLVADLIYAIVSGRGRGRGTVGGLAATGTWRTVMLSTGEQPATSFTQDGGTRTRVLTIKGIPFGESNYETGQMVRKMDADLRRHYGHAGVRFLQWLMRERPKWDEWREKYLAAVELYSAAVAIPEAGRLAQSAALVSMAGAMAHLALDLPWKYQDPTFQIWQELARETADAAGDHRALEHVLSVASSREHTFIGRFAKNGWDERIPTQISGRWDPGADWKFLAFYPNVLKEILRVEGFAPEAILGSWREQKFLQCEAGRFTWSVKIGDGDKKAKMIVINRSAFEGLGEVGDNDDAL